MARVALDEARRSPALRWAPFRVSEAEGTYRAAMAELRRQESRFFLLRDFRSATSLLEQAIAEAEGAVEEGQRISGARRSAAERALREVAEALSAMDDLETRATLPREQRAGLTAARMGFVEATSLLEAGAYTEAEARAKVVLARAARVAEALGDAFLRFADEERVRAWRRWIDETIAWSREHAAVAVVVVKEKNLLTVYRNGRELRSYAADLGSNNLAQKYRQGDQATPEGRYKVKQIKGRGQTRYYRALLLDYPNAEDLRRIRAAKEAGIIPADASPGALIEIHGEGGRGEDWTNGCVAVTNREMDELLRLVRVGTPVTIVGGDGSHGSFSSVAERIRRER
jgi:L,D-peptidoglycan transpeptidase YkuD (ErfK/YbiS/YcfS/YnhG family)